MQALVEHKGKQFLVEENSEFKFPYLGGEVGEKIEYKKKYNYWFSDGQSV